jgi:hypothetical protein
VSLEKRWRRQAQHHGVDLEGEGLCSCGDCVSVARICSGAVGQSGEEGQEFDHVTAPLFSEACSQFRLLRLSINVYCS